MTDEELYQLRINGMQGLDLSPGDELCYKAYNEIIFLQEQVSNLKDYIETLKRSHAMLHASRKMDGAL